MVISDDNDLSGKDKPNGKIYAYYACEKRARLSAVVEVNLRSELI